MSERISLPSKIFRGATIAAIAAANSGCIRWNNEYRATETAIAQAHRLTVEPPTITPVLPTETASPLQFNQTPEATKTLTPEEVRAKLLSEFVFDGYDLGNTPFKLNLPDETAVALGWSGAKSYYEQTSTPVTEKDFTQKEIDLMEQNINDSSDPNIGNRFLSTLIVGMRGAVIFMHSYKPESGGDFVWNLGGKLRQLQEGSIKSDNWTGKPVEMDFGNGKKLEGQIKFVLNIDVGVWNKGKNNIDSWDRGQAPIHLRPDVVGVPNEFMNDPDPKALYVLFVACNNEVEGTESDILGIPIHQRNQAKRTIVVVRFQLP